MAVRSAAALLAVTATDCSGNQSAAELYCLLASDIVVVVAVVAAQRTLPAESAVAAVIVAELEAGSSSAVRVLAPERLW